MDSDIDCVTNLLRITFTGTNTDIIKHAESNLSSMASKSANFFRNLMIICANNSLIDKRIKISSLLYIKFMLRNNTLENEIFCDNFSFFFDIFNFDPDMLHVYTVTLRYYVIIIEKCRKNVVDVFLDFFSRNTEKALFFLSVLSDYISKYVYFVPFYNFLTEFTFSNILSDSMYYYIFNIYGNLIDIYKSTKNEERGDNDNCYNLNAWVELILKYSYYEHLPNYYDIVNLTSKIFRTLLCTDFSCEVYQGRIYDISVYFVGSDISYDYTINFLHVISIIISTNIDLISSDLYLNVLIPFLDSILKSVDEPGEYGISLMHDSKFVLLFKKLLVISAQCTSLEYMLNLLNSCLSNCICNKSSHYICCCWFYSILISESEHRYSIESDFIILLSEILKSDNSVLYSGVYLILSRIHVDFNLGFFTIFLRSLMHIQSDMFLLVISPKAMHSMFSTVDISSIDSLSNNTITDLVEIFLSLVSPYSLTCLEPLISFFGLIMSIQTLEYIIDNVNTMITNILNDFTVHYQVLTVLRKVLVKALECLSRMENTEQIINSEVYIINDMLFSLSDSSLVQFFIDIYTDIIPIKCISCNHFIAVLFHIGQLFISNDNYYLLDYKDIIIKLLLRARHDVVNQDVVRYLFHFLSEIVNLDREIDFSTLSEILSVLVLISDIQYIDVSLINFVISSVINDVQSGDYYEGVDLFVSILLRSEICVKTNLVKYEKLILQKIAEQASSNTKKYLHDNSSCISNHDKLSILNTEVYHEEEIESVIELFFNAED